VTTKYNSPCFDNVIMWKNGTKYIADRGTVQTWNWANGHSEIYKKKTAIDGVGHSWRENG